MSEPLVLGIDAGNTKTIALVADATGRVLGAGRAGQSNIYASETEALSAIERAVQEARSSAGLGPGPLAALTLSATGADWPEDFQLLEEALVARGWAERVRVVNDAVGALRAGSLVGTGVAVVCGTSTGIAARSPQGRVWHSSFWQEPEGAEELARLALRAVYRAELGIDPPTALTAQVLAQVGCATPEALLHRCTARGSRPLPLGGLARVLLDVAEEGDPTARALVTRHGAALGDYALAAARQVGLNGNYLLVTSGGVMRHPSPLLRDALMARVHAQHPGVRWQASHHEPVFGALLLALESLGGPVSETLFRRLEETTPDAALFST